MGRSAAALVVLSMTISRWSCRWVGSWRAIPGTPGWRVNRICANTRCGVIDNRYRCLTYVGPISSCSPGGSSIEAAQATIFRRLSTVAGSTGTVPKNNCPLPTRR